MSVGITPQWEESLNDCQKLLELIEIEKGLSRHVFKGALLQEYSTSIDIAENCVKDIIQQLKELKTYEESL